MASLLAVCVVQTLHDDAGSVGTTAINKRAISGPVRVRPLGLNADVQADRKHHGGLDKAVYVYAQEDADYWVDQLGRPLEPGWFGENLRVVGLDVSGALIGDRWQFGSGENSVTLEVTMPREPCATFARWVVRSGGEPADARGWVKRFTAAGRPGAYARVIRPGMISAGDAIIRVGSAIPGAESIAHVFSGIAA
ncbi:MAG: MOSC domain-containing protein [Microbacteriaceae bacterium]|nr:MOSC domain-containing protein [Microbacteriaceae bacterium]